MTVLRAQDVAGATLGVGLLLGAGFYAWLDLKSPEVERPSVEDELAQRMSDDLGLRQPRVTCETWGDRAAAGERALCTASTRDRIYEVTVTFDGAGGFSYW